MHGVSTKGPLTLKYCSGITNMNTPGHSSRYTMSADQMKRSKHSTHNRTAEM